MDETGKSDSRIVPKKVPNKAGRPAAEGTGGKAAGQAEPATGHHAADTGPNTSARGTGRVRQAAEQQKGERFTALLHHIYAIDTLRAAFYELET